MSRVKIKFPAEKPLTTLSISVRIGDINYGGHLGNDSVLSIIHEARVHWLADAGMTEMNAGGVGLIIADVAIAYKGESFYGDVLAVAIYAVEITGVSFDLLYDISTQRNGMGVSIAQAKTGMVCFNYEKRKVTALPPALKSVLENV